MDRSDYRSRPVPACISCCQLIPSGILSRSSGELAAVLPALRTAKRLRGAATRDRDATFVPGPGLRRPGPATACPQVAIAGAWTATGWPATMESAVRSGRAAARVLAAHLDKSGRRKVEGGSTAEGGRWE